MDGATIVMLLVASAFGVARGVDYLRNTESVTSNEGSRPIRDSSSTVEVGTGVAVGAGDHAATMIVFHDMACGWCAEQDSILRLVMKRYPDHFRIVYKDFVESDGPVFESHVAAHCVAHQHRYSEFLQLGYENPALVSARSGWREILAMMPGVFSDSVESCMSGSGGRERVRANTAEARQLGLTMTPSSVANGQLFQGSLTFEIADSIVTSMINRERLL